MKSKIVKIVALVILISGFIVLDILFFKPRDSAYSKEGLQLKFANRVSKKWQYHGLRLELKNGPDLTPYLFDDDMDHLEVGDSIVKEKDENICTVYKPDGQVLHLKFLYLK